MTAKLTQVELVSISGLTRVRDQYYITLCIEKKKKLEREVTLVDVSPPRKQSVVHERIWP